MSQSDSQTPKPTPTAAEIAQLIDRRTFDQAEQEQILGALLRLRPTRAAMTLSEIVTLIEHGAFDVHCRDLIGEALAKMRTHMQASPDKISAKMSVTIAFSGEDDVITTTGVATITLPKRKPRRTSLFMARAGGLLESPEGQTTFPTTWAQTTPSDPGKTVVVFPPVSSPVRT